MEIFLNGSSEEALYEKERSKTTVSHFLEINFVSTGLPWVVLDLYGPVALPSQIQDNHLAPSDSKEF